MKQRIREDRVFKNMDELRVQLGKDKEQAIKMLKNTSDSNEL